MDIHVIGFGLKRSTSSGLAFDLECNKSGISCHPLGILDEGIGFGGDSFVQALQCLDLKSESQPGGT